MTVRGSPTGFINSFFSPSAMQTHRVAIPALLMMTFRPCAHPLGAIRSDLQNFSSEEESVKFRGQDAVGCSAERSDTIFRFTRSKAVFNGASHWFFWTPQEREYYVRLQSERTQCGGITAQ
jgi:hypothetical protein